MRVDGDKLAVRVKICGALSQKLKISFLLKESSTSAQLSMAVTQLHCNWVEGPRLAMNAGI